MSMMKIPTIAVLTGCLTLSAVMVGLPTPSRSLSLGNRIQMAQAAPCKQLVDFPQSPIQILPQPFETGCALSTPLRANNPGTIVYVLQAGLRSPVTASSTGELTELTVQQTETWMAILVQHCRRGGSRTALTVSNLFG